MRNYSIIFLMLMLCSSIMMTAQPSQKLTGLSISSSNSNSDPSKLINEQAALPNSPSTPTSTPTDGWSYWAWDDAELDLNGNYTVTHIYLYDAYGSPDFGVDYLDANDNWQTIDDVTLSSYLQWISVPMNGSVSTSKLRFRKMDSSTSVFEVAVYGYSGGNCPPAGTPCDDGNSNTENDQEDGNCNCIGTPIVSGSCLADKNAGGNAANIAVLDAAYNNPSPHTFQQMMGINDAGQFQGIEDAEVNPISYLTPHMRAFHAMDYDFNFNLQFGTPYESLVKPKDTDGYPPNIDDVRNYTNFTGLQGMTDISAATEILNKGSLTWKEKIWQESDWYNLTGGMTIPDGIRQSFQNYTEAFIDVHAPSFGNQLVSSYEVGNELWDYPNAGDYHAMLEGAYNAFVDEYGTNTANWRMKLLPGSFNAASTVNTCGTALRDFSNCGSQAGDNIYYQMGDYLDVDNCDILSSFYAINTHAYPFGEGTLSYVHPEQEDNEFLTFKAAVAFRDANPVFNGKGVWLTETGYDSYNAPGSCNGSAPAGVGELSQAAMNLRIFLMTSRYHIERVNFYMGFDNNRTSNIYHGCTYSSSGFWKLGTHPQYGYGSARPTHGATPKPIFFTFSDFLDKFNNKVFTEAVAENDNVYAYILANQDGSDPYLVFWSPTATNESNALNSLNINQFINLPSGYKVATTAATPFSTTGNATTPPFAPSAASSFTAVNGTSTGSTTITRVKRMPSYIRLTTGGTTTCDDGVQNQGETGVDCGGPCPACETCNDGIQNQGETGIDCGGPCPACPSGCNTPQQITLLPNDVSQSSNHISNPNATADKAVDGNTTGAWNQLSQTNWGLSEWWQADLGENYDIDQVNLWNITTGNQGHMVNIHVFVSDSPFTSNDFATTQNSPNVDDYLISGQLGRPSTININSTGRYVRVQKQGQGFITLDEVQITGCPDTGCPPLGTSCDDGDASTENDIEDGNCNCAGTPITSGNPCQDIQISPGNGSVTISNIAPTMQLQIIGQGTGWQNQDICNGDCNSSETAFFPPGNYTIKAINPNPGCYVQYDNVIILSNKLSQLNDEQRLLIFPNPIKNNHPTLVLDSPEDEQLDIQIYNINSQLVHSQQASTVSGLNEITLDLQHARLASGVYFVKVISEKYTYGATRFVKP